MQEEDFFMAILGLDSALKKLDKILILELKHLKKQAHISILQDLLVKIYVLQGKSMG